MHVLLSGDFWGRSTAVWAPCVGYVAWSRSELVETYFVQNFMRIQNLASILTSEVAPQSTRANLKLASKHQSCFSWQFWNLTFACFWQNAMFLVLKINQNCLPKIPLYICMFEALILSLLLDVDRPRAKIKWKSSWRFAILSTCYDFGNRSKIARSQFSGIKITEEIEIFRVFVNS